MCKFRSALKYASFFSILALSTSCEEKVDISTVKVGLLTENAMSFASVSVQQLGSTVHVYGNQEGANTAMGKEYSFREFYSSDFVNWTSRVIDSSYVMSLDVRNGVMASLLYGTPDSDSCTLQILNAESGAFLSSARIPGGGHVEYFNDTTLYVASQSGLGLDFYHVSEDGSILDYVRSVELIDTAHVASWGQKFGLITIWNEMHETSTRYIYDIVEDDYSELIIPAPYRFLDIDLNEGVLYYGDFNNLIAKRISDTNIMGNWTLSKDNDCRIRRVRQIPTGYLLELGGRTTYDYYDQDYLSGYLVLNADSNKVGLGVFPEGDKLPASLSILFKPTGNIKDGWQYFAVSGLVYLYQPEVLRLP